MNHQSSPDLVHVALVIQRDELSMLPPASCKAAIDVEDGNVQDCILYRVNVSIYIVIRKDAVNKANHHFHLFFLS